ncbi:MAG TPA: GlsB/YeaQ/YmgE family stress response membrane protein [Blastocatellia bacterium]|nr:GlsB/YeaQ/YmgE family stress response membrane protein [Blastocatellia bacterium]
MGILSWIVMGLIVGVIAKFVMPGKDPGGIIITILLGIAGAFVGGYIASYLKIGTTVSGFNLISILTAVGGAILLLILYRVIKR